MDPNSRPQGLPSQTQPYQHQQQQQRPAHPPTRPRAKSGFSFRSNNSGPDSKPHKRKESLIESSAEKRRNHMSDTTKANPNAAIHEAQPIAAALEESTLSHLSNIRCSDVYGNPIEEPDRSNPTRRSKERPLETLKGFEFAIDRAYRERAKYQPPDANLQSRRSSSVWQSRNGNQGDANHTPRLSQVIHPNGSGNFHRRDSYGEGTYGPPPHGRFNQAQQSDPRLNRYPQAGMYPPNINTRSRDTLNTGASSGSEQWNNPSGSDQDSLEKAKGVIKPGPSGYQNGYGPASGHPNALPQGYPVGSSPSLQNGYQNGAQNGHQGGQPIGPPMQQAQAGYQNPYPPNGYPMARPQGGGHPADYRPGNGPYQRPHPSQNGSGYHPGLGEKPLPALGQKFPISLNAQPIPTGAVQPLPGQKQKRQSWFKRRFSKD